MGTGSYVGKDTAPAWPGPPKTELTVWGGGGARPPWSGSCMGTASDRPGPPPGSTLLRLGPTIRLDGRQRPRRPGPPPCAGPPGLSACPLYGHGTVSRTFPQRHGS